jgi:hypothetical protein
VSESENNDHNHSHSHEAEIDEAVEETFPSSDPPSTWAGADSDDGE